MVGVCIKYCVVKDDLECECYSRMPGLITSVDMSMDVIFVSCKWFKL